MNEEVPPPEPQNPQVPKIPPIPKGPPAPYVEGDMTNSEIRAALRVLSQLMRTQGKIVLRHVDSKYNIGVGPQPQPNASAPTSRIWNFMRMIPHTFRGTKVD